MMNGRKFSLFLLLFFFLVENRCLAQEEPALITTTVRNDSASYSVNMRSLTLNYQNNRRNILWPYDNTKEKAMDLGLTVVQNKGNTANMDFEGNSVSGTLGNMFSSSNYTSATFGVHVLRNKLASEDAGEFDELIWGLKHLYTVGDFQTTLAYKRDFMYSDLFLPAGVEDHLIEDDIQLNAKMKLGTSSEYYAGFKHNFINDGNQFTSFQTGVNFQHQWRAMVASGGINGNYGMSKFTTVSYPSPFYVFGVGPQAGLTYLMRENLTVGASGSYSRFIDNLKIVGYETSRSAYLEWGNRNKAEFVLAYVRMDSIAQGEKWFDNQLNLALNYSM